MTGFILLAILAVTPEYKYQDSNDFLAKHRTAISRVCAKYKSTHCFVRKEPNASMDDLGLSVESGTYKWVLYGKKARQ